MPSFVIKTALLLCDGFFFGVLYSFYDYYLFTCFSMAINSFCNLNLALSLLVRNTRNPQNPFSPQGRTYYTLP